MNSSRNSPVIIFDAVGTLIYARPTVAEVYHRLGAQFGWSGTIVDIQARFGAVFGAASSSGSRDHATNEIEQRSRWRSIVGAVFETLPSDTLDLIFDQLWRHFADAASWQIYPDAVQAIELCENRGWRWCIGSNFDCRLHQVIAGHPLLQRTERTFCSSEVGFDKPATQFFRAIEQRLAVPAQLLVMIGDDQRLDADAAQAAGWKSIWIDRKSKDPCMQLHLLLQAVSF